MTKSILPTFKKWTVDEKRLLVIFLLILIYPVFVSCSFALYVFVIIPVMVSPYISVEETHQAKWFHLYWLFVSMLWVVLCVSILPCFKKKGNQHMGDLSNVKSSLSTQAPIKIEIEDEKDNQSNFSKMSENYSDDIKKSPDLESDKKSLEKVTEGLQKSSTSLNRRQLTQSGEFLNDFMSTIQSDDEKNEIVCEIHAEENKGNIKETESDFDHKQRDLMDGQRDHDSKKNESEDETRMDTDSKRSSKVEDVSTEKCANKSIQGTPNRYSDSCSQSSNSSEDVEPFTSVHKAKCPVVSPQKANEAIFEQQENIARSEIMEEVDELDDNFSRQKLEKALPSIDTSRTSGYYECSLPTGKCLERQNSQNNTVFLFINPETATTQDSIKMSHGENLETPVFEKTEP